MSEDKWILASEQLPEVSEEHPLSDILLGIEDSPYTSCTLIGMYRYWWRYGEFRRLVNEPNWPKKVNLKYWRNFPNVPPEAS